MFVLLIPLLLLLLLIAGIGCFIKRRLVMGSVLVVSSLILNYVSETYAFKSIFSTNTYNGSRIRVMTYNIHNNGVYFDRHPDGVDSLMSFITRENPDIIFLTEYWKYKRPQLAEMLHGMYPYCSANVFDKPDKTDFFLCSRYPVSNVHRFQRQGLRQMLVHGMDIEINGVKVKLIGCHLKSNDISKVKQGGGLGEYWANLRRGYDLRQQQSERIRDSVMFYNGPVVVVGDMNDISGSYVLRTMKKAGLRDAWWEGGLGYGTTYASKRMRWRIDHILFSNDFEVGDVRVPSVPFSDHFPVIADLYIKN